MVFSLGIPHILLSLRLSLHTRTIEYSGQNMPQGMAMKIWNNQPRLSRLPKEILFPEIPCLYRIFTGHGCSGVCMAEALLVHPTSSLSFTLLPPNALWVSPPSSSSPFPPSSCFQHWALCSAALPSFVVSPLCCLSLRTLGEGDGSRPIHPLPPLYMPHC
jgi:hypothetical protein